jgi:RNA 3'-terminal phosphate cyclase (ATP)
MPFSPTPPHHLDGTTLEGGGQLLRLALGLSSLTKTSINITNIRGKRSGGGGLKAQHLTCAQWLAQACGAHLSGADIKSKEITFIPSASNGPEMAGEVRISQSTPGSVNLILQAILPYVLFSGARGMIRVCVEGGTNVSNSPSCEYITQVLVPMLERIGIPRIGTKVHSRGWSQGASRVGSVTYSITPLSSRLPAFQLRERGEIESVSATIIAPKGTEKSFREELDIIFERLESYIFGAGARDAFIDVAFEDSQHDKRYYLLLVVTTSTGMRLGRDWLYDRSFRLGKLEQIVPTVVKKVFEDLMAEIGHGGCVDEYLRDQLVVFQALAHGRSAVYGGKKKDALVQPSLHATTAQWVAQEMLGVAFDGKGGCEGVGFLAGGGEKEKESDAVEVDLTKELEQSNVCSS